MPGKSPGKSVLGKSVLDHISTESPYEHLVKEELAQLQKVLLHQHTLETKNLKSSNERLRKELEKYEAIVEEQKIKESLNLGYVPVEPLAPPMERWAMFAERLMEDHPAGDEKEVYEDELPKEELHMRSVWKVSLQEMMRRRHHGMVLATRGESDAQMRMNEAVLEDSCLQKLVVYPRSSKQLIWSTVGSFLILWDLVTIPLGIFDLPDFIKFLTIAARVSFFYWLIDMPLHFLFGIEIGGAAELRPSKLARCRSGLCTGDDRWCQLCSVAGTLSELARVRFHFQSHRSLADEVAYQAVRQIQAIVDLDKQTNSQVVSLSDRLANTQKHLAEARRVVGSTTAPKSAGPRPSEPRRAPERDITPPREEEKPDKAPAEEADYGSQEESSEEEEEVKKEPDALEEEAPPRERPGGSAPPPEPLDPPRRKPAREERERSRSRHRGRRGGEKHKEARRALQDPNRDTEGVWGDEDPPPEGGARETDRVAEARAMGLVSLLQPDNFWEAHPVRPGCVLDIPISQVTDGKQSPGCVIVFVQEVLYLAHGCQCKVRFLGGDPDWARAEGIKVFSRERRSLHLCMGGVDACTADNEKLYHVELFGIYPPGLPPPECVEKAKRREWSKLYQELMGSAPPLAAPGAGVEEKEAEENPPERDAVDRISALRKRLQASRGGEVGGLPPRAGLPPTGSRVTFAPRPLAIEPRAPVKKEAERGPVIRVPSDSDGEESRRHRKKSSMGDALAAAVAQRAQQSGGAAASSRGRSRSRGRRKRRRSRERRRDSRSSSSGEQTSSSSSLVPPLQKKANKDPGSVLKLLLSNVAEALAEAAIDTSKSEGQLQGKGNQLTSYFQIVAKLQMAGKVRDLRELETLARCVDHLKSGRLAELGDALAGRFLAVESAAITNNWQDAQHLEVVPIRHAGLAPPSIMLQAQRHTRQVEKSLGRNQWRRSGGPAAPYKEGAAAEKGNQGKGKGDRQGRGKGKYGKNANRNAWKGAGKEKAAEGGGGGEAPKT
eukprot:s280_g14.t1